MEILKNIKQEEIIQLASLVSIASGQVVSKTIIQNEHVSITLFAFDKDEEIATHESNGDALVQILEGSATITINDKEHLVHKDESIVMPHNVPHAVYASEVFKMMLIQVF